jgi:hypothetical protein
MPPDNHKLLVGKIAFQVFKANNSESLNEGTSTEGTHVLDGFEIVEVLGFALALKEDASVSQRCIICLHPSDFYGYPVPPEYLDDTATVDLRNKDSDKITIIPVFNSKAKASFSWTDKTDVTSITVSKNVDDQWIPTIIQHLNLEDAR